MQHSGRHTPRYARLRADARGRDGGVREELAAGIAPRRPWRGRWPPRNARGASARGGSARRALAAHQPSVGAYVDAQQGWLYVYTNFNSVRFSTDPAGELTMAVGARPTLGPFEFDIGAEYYYYPGEIGPEHSNYWEAHATVSHKLTDKITWGSTLAYAPNIWQTGASGTYASGTVSFDLPSEFLPAEVSWSLSADVGRWLFGPTSSGGGVSAAGGGLPLPDFTNWHAGLTFTYRVFKLGLNYTDTNLSKRADGRRRSRTGRDKQSGRQSPRITLGPLRRDILGDTRRRNRSCDVRPLTTRCASRFSARHLISRDGFAPRTHRPPLLRKRPALGRPLRSSKCNQGVSAADRSLPRLVTIRPE